MSYLKTYPLSISNFLRHALYQHYREYRGQYPRRIVLHPAVIDSLMQEISVHEMISMQPIKGLQDFKFVGVEIEIDPLATRPKLISCRNEVEYL